MARGKLIGFACTAALTGCGGGDEPRPTAAQTTEAPPPSEQPDSVDRLQLSLPEALGQTIVARYTGPRPSRALLGRIRRGQVGGVILFADNVDQPSAGIRAAIRSLHRAARAGARPKVLVMVDQEGGLVKRLPGPPSTAARGMRDPLAQGVATGRMLRG